jgi:hypothetical protein
VAAGSASRCHASRRSYFSAELWLTKSAAAHGRMQQLISQQQIEWCEEDAQPHRIARTHSHRHTLYTLAQIAPTIAIAPPNLAHQEALPLRWQTRRRERGRSVWKRETGPPESKCSTAACWATPLPNQRRTTRWTSTGAGAAATAWSWGLAASASPPALAVRMSWVVWG